MKHRSVLESERLWLRVWEPDDWMVFRRLATDPRAMLLVVSLQPRKMAGELSEGMLLDIGYTEGLTPVLAVPESPVPNGARAG